jgi:hypothetical protein
MLCAFSPQAFGHRERINFMFLPPLPLIARGMVLLMVNGAEGYREFVADLEPKALGLGEADVMRMARRSPTNKTGLLGDKAQMLLGSDPLWFADGKHALVDLGARTVMGCVVGRGRQLLLAANLRLSKGDGAVLQVCHQLGRNSGPWQGVLLQAPVQGAHGFDILFPNGEKKLDISSLAHGLTKRGGKFAGSIETYFSAT